MSELLEKYVSVAEDYYYDPEFESPPMDHAKFTKALEAVNADRNFPNVVNIIQQGIEVLVKFFSGKTPLSENIDNAAVDDLREINRLLKEELSIAPASTRAR